MMGTRDGKARKNHHWNRTGHVAAKAATCNGGRHRAGGERVVGNHLVGVARDKCTRCTACLIVHRPLFEPVVKRSHSRIKRFNIVMTGQTLRCSGHSPYSKYGSLFPWLSCSHRPAQSSIWFWPRIEAR